MTHTAYYYNDLVSFDKDDQTIASFVTLGPLPVDYQVLMNDWRAGQISAKEIQEIVKQITD